MWPGSRPWTCPRPPGGRWSIWRWPRRGSRPGRSPLQAEGDRGAGRAVRDRPRGGLRPRPRGRPRASPGGHHPVAVLGARASRCGPPTRRSPWPWAWTHPALAARSGARPGSTSPSRADPPPRPASAPGQGRPAGRRRPDRPHPPGHQPRGRSRAGPGAARRHPDGLVHPGPPAPPDPDPHRGRPRARDRHRRDRGHPARPARRPLREHHRTARRPGPARPRSPPGRDASTTWTVEARAARKAGAPETLDQLRFDLAVGHLTAGAFGLTLVAQGRSGAPASAARKPPHEQAQAAAPAPVPTPDDPDQHHHRRHHDARPGQPARRAAHARPATCPIPAELARALAHDPDQATWRRILCDPATGIADRGLRRLPARRPGRRLRRRAGRAHQPLPHQRRPHHRARPRRGVRPRGPRRRRPRPVRPTWPPPASATTRPRPTGSSM